MFVLSGCKIRFVIFSDNTVVFNLEAFSYNPPSKYLIISVSFFSSIFFSLISSPISKDASVLLSLNACSNFLSSLSSLLFLISLL